MERLSINGKDYLFSLNSTSSSVHFKLTDLTTMWNEALQESAITERFKECNPRHSLSVCKIIEKLIQTLHKRDVKDFTTEGTEARLEISPVVVGSFKCRFYFSLTSSTCLFHSDIMKPLLQVINELQYRESVLINLLKAKDKEITEHKLEGSEIKRLGVETEPFNEKKFIEMCNVGLIERVRAAQERNETLKDCTVFNLIKSVFDGTFTPPTPPPDVNRPKKRKTRRLVFEFLEKPANPVPVQKKKKRENIF